jgi:hypothetical protein
MYAPTTWVQVVRAVSVWVLGAGLAMLLFLWRDVLTWQLPEAVFILGVIALGGGGIGWARWQLGELDHRNRPFLMSSDGASILTPRREFLAGLTRVKRVLLAAFFVSAGAFVYLISAVNCPPDQGGFCGAVATPSEATLQLLQSLSLGIGLIYLAAVVLSRTHDAETDRLDAMIAEGRKRRRDDGPLAGAGGRGWE